MEDSTEGNAEEKAPKKTLLDIYPALRGPEIKDLQDALLKELETAAAEDSAVRKRRLDYETDIARRRIKTTSDLLALTQKEFTALTGEIETVLERVLSKKRGLISSLKDVFADLTTQHRLTAKAQSDLELVRKRFQETAEEVVKRTNRVRQLANAVGSQAGVAVSREILQGLELSLSRPEEPPLPEIDVVPAVVPAVPQSTGVPPMFALSWLATGLISTAMSMQVTWRFLTSNFGAHISDYVPIQTEPFGYRGQNQSYRNGCNCEQCSRKLNAYRHRFSACTACRWRHLS